MRDVFFVLETQTDVKGGCENAFQHQRRAVGRSCQCYNAQLHMTYKVSNYNYWFQNWANTKVFRSHY